MRRILPLLLLTLAAGPALAQVTVNQRKEAAPDGRIEIENTDGSIKVMGWDKPEILVTGTLGRGAAGLELSGGPRRTHIAVLTEGAPHGVKNDLEIHVPAASRLEIESFGASITLTGVTGPVQVESVNGSIRLDGGSKDVELQTVNGSVEVSSPATRLKAESVNGAVTVRGASGDLEASTVNGALLVSGGTFERAHLETVSGSLRFEGKLEAHATLEAESVSGSVELLLPADVSADFTVSTFSGGVVNDLGPAARKTGRHTPEKELTFSTGSGSATVNVETLSGSITIRKR